MKENQRTISDWGNQTFGPNSPLAIATRMNVEVAELLNCLQNLQETEGRVITQNRLDEICAMRKEAGRECADVYIMLVQIADALGIDLHEQSDEKMAVNRNRTWERTATGKMQHTATGKMQHTETGHGPSTTAHEDQFRAGCDHSGCDYPAGECSGACMTKKDRPADQFYDHGSGLTMDVNKWYILSDSGSYYRAEGFDSAESALLWSMSPEGKDRLGGLTATFPHFLEDKSGFDGIEAVNIFSGRDLRDYWIACEETPARTEVAQ